LSFKYKEYLKRPRATLTSRITAGGDLHPALRIPI
jgi:hypothetical protein